MGNRIPPALVAQADTFVALRRDLHRHPECYGLITQKKGETLAADGTPWPASH